MFELRFAPASFDLIWAEGSLYNLGIERALKDLRSLLACGGILAFTELSWLSNDRPAEVAGCLITTALTEEVAP